MSLPHRQQAVLDRMDRTLELADPQLRSAYAAFTRRTREAPFPAVEVIRTLHVRYVALVLAVLLAISFLAFGISSLSGNCAVSRCAASTTTSAGRH
jgi:hypothetical protein